MPYIDLHAKPFDEATLAKLQIFEDYAQAWLPVFVMSRQKEICIFDFFAGTGYDKNGIAGSPIRILEVIRQYVGKIFQERVKIVVFLNEYKKAKFEILQEACNKYLEENKEVKRAIDIKFSNLDFEVCFKEWYPFIQQNPSLVFLDQNGIKYFSEKYFIALEKTRKTDFLYFISSSYFWRFGESEEFKMHLDIDIEDAKKDPYTFIHRNLIKQVYSKLPQKSQLKLYPFSLKKGANIHGIIFGASHIRAVDKFLEIAWKKNPINGEANFDIDEDKKKLQLDMFEGKRLTKIEAFEVALADKIKSSKTTTNKEIYYFTLQSGHPCAQANTIIKELRKAKKVSFTGISPKINYKTTKEEIIEIKWL
jgi:three-Cys-motif partner protein